VAGYIKKNLSDNGRAYRSRKHTTYAAPPLTEAQRLAEIDLVRDRLRKIESSLFWADLQEQADLEDAVAEARRRVELLERRRAVANGSASGLILAAYRQ
jgi:hypothetical protein